MNSLLSKPFTVLLPALAAFLLVQACGGGGDANAQASAADPVEGVWESVVNVRDCSSGAPLRSFEGLTNLLRGGGVLAVNNQPPTQFGAAMGRWSAGASAGSYTIQFRFFRFNADGSPAGSQRVTHSWTVDGGGATATGTIAAQVLDPADNVIASICAQTTNTRVG